MSSRFIAVFDVGKTNKKVIIFDEKLRVVDSVYQTFDEYVTDGIHYEDVENITEWFLAQLTIFAKKYPVAAISVTTHGATAMCLDKTGRLAIPPVAYTTDAGEEFSAEFFNRFGSREELQKSTATAEIGNMINVAKVLFFAKKTWPDRFANVAHILNYPQYFGYVLTGNFGAEPTYVGCHTYLFDFARKSYSDVARMLGVETLLPRKISRSWEVLGYVSPTMAQQTGLSPQCVVTMGIHDSNSALLPYLVKGHKDFVLNSTGTWCVAMHPSKSLEFAPDEIGKTVFYNMDAFFNPVKTVIFMGGLEFETYTKILKKICGDRSFPAFNPQVYEQLIAQKQRFVVPSVVKGAGIFPDAQPKVIDGDKVYNLRDIESGANVPAFFSDFDTAFAAVVLSLAVQTRIALDMVGLKDGGSIFTEGGFRKNVNYNSLVSAMYPGSTVAVTNLTEATAFGAALLAKAALDKVTPMQSAPLFEIETVPVAPTPLGDINSYIEAFRGHCR